MKQQLISRAAEFTGSTAAWYMDLTTGEVISHEPKKPFIAASVIKLFIMAEAFARFEDGSMSPDEEFIVAPEMKMPSCGALTYMHDGLRVTAMDLVVLMIILSDNSATNMLIDRLGIENINRRIDAVGCNGCRLNRRLFDSESSRRGIQNYITAEGVGRLLKLIWDKKLISEKASEKMLSILLDQRLNGKIPFFLDCDVAHKTGEDSGTTHDAAIVLSEKPFILVMLSNDTDVPVFERYMQDTARALTE